MPNYTRQKFRLGVVGERGRAPPRTSLEANDAVRGVDPDGTGVMSPNIYEGGTSMVMPPSNISEVMSFRLSLFYLVTATTVVCCILMQILRVVSQKSF